MGNGACTNFDVNAAGKITVIKGASGLQFGGDAVGGLIIIEPVSLKKTLFWENYSKSSVRGGSMSQVYTKEMIKDGVGMHWEQSSIWETKKHPIMSCLTQGIEKLTFLAI
jgi:iron complex outermembrane receptor protein